MEMFIKLEEGQQFHESLGKVEWISVEQMAIPPPVRPSHPQKLKMWGYTWKGLLPPPHTRATRQVHET